MIDSLVDILIFRDKVGFNLRDEMFHGMAFVDEIVGVLGELLG